MATLWDCKELTTGKDFHDFLLNRVRQSGQEILIATRRFEFDAFGQSLLSELEYACQRGLRVCCLLDAKGCRQFITEHPVLLNKLETRFRLYSEEALPGNLIIFDSRLAVRGSHTLCDDGLTAEGHSQVFRDPEAASIQAATFSLAWEQAQIPPEG